MKKFIFVEDRDPETGHGWRDHPHRIFAEDKDGPIRAKVLDEDGQVCGPTLFAECSYAWICPEDYYDQYGHFPDNIRSTDVKASYPDFKGASDMESHFEFHMSPREMKKYLIKLGLTERPRRG